TFQQISWGRFGIFLTTSIVRVAVASVLLVAGILWLARTTSISELMLNAVALNAILDVDEFLFNGLTPMKFQHAIQSLTPMTVKYSRRRSEWESSVQCITLILTIIVPYMLLVKPFGETMVEVKELLCGGNQSFVLVHNADTQMTNGLITREGR
ncbi:NLRC3, partial [Symbiodinium microadriaticum]